MYTVHDTSLVSFPEYILGASNGPNNLCTLLCLCAEYVLCIPCVSTISLALICYFWESPVSSFLSLLVSHYSIDFMIFLRVTTLA